MTATSTVSGAVSTPAEAREIFQRIRESLSRVIIGQDEIIELLFCEVEFRDVSGLCE